MQGCAENPWLVPARGCHPTQVVTAQRCRLDRVLADVRAVTGTDAVLLPSNSNDTWRLGQHVLRVGWRGDVARLQREADLAVQLPPEVRYPPLVESGHTGDLAWILTRWVEGTPLDDIWPRMDLKQRRRSAGQLADVLHALHAWSPPPRTARALGSLSPPDRADAAALIGRTLNPLPVANAIALAEHTRALPWVDRGVVDQAVDRLRDLAGHDPFADPARHVVVHGDAHMANLLWHDGDLAALLDLEWARLGPPDLELEPFLRSVDWSGHDPESMPPAEMTALFTWLSADYPGLFAAPGLLERLWLYQIAYTLREIWTWPAAERAEDLRPDHPLNLLATFVRRAGHLEQLLGGVR